MYWAIGLALAFAVAAVLALLLAPAQTKLEIDTSGGVAIARIRPLWGLGPRLVFGADKSRSRRSGIALLLRHWREAPRMLNALLVLPKLIRPAGRLLSDVRALAPNASRCVVSLNAVHPTANLFVQGAGKVTQSLVGGEIRGRETPGIDILAHIEARAAPLQLWRIYRRFRSAEAVREFARRLNAPAKPSPERSR